MSKYNLPPMAFKDRCTVAVECLPNAPYKTMLANLLDEMLAAIERQSVPAGYVRFCPECGKTGEVRSTARDCCPDGSHAAYMPEKTAEVCSKLFHDLLAAARQPQPVQPTANSGDAEKAELDRMAKYVSTITQSEIDEADGDRGITSPQAQAAHGITKGTT